MTNELLEKMRARVGTLSSVEREVNELVGCHLALHSEGSRYFSVSSPRATVPFFYSFEDPDDVIRLHAFIGEMIAKKLAAKRAEFAAAEL